MKQEVIIKLAILLCVLSMMPIEARSESPQRLALADFQKWVQNEADYWIAPNSYYCCEEKRARGAANYILQWGSITKEDPGKQRL